MEETTDKLLEALQALGAELRTSVADGMAKISQRCDAIEEKIAAKKSDNDDDTMAEQVAADQAGHRAVRNAEMRADAVDPAAFASLASRVNEMAKRNSRPMADLNAYADAQAKADTVMRTHGESAQPPMSGEDIIAYNIRLARPMQAHSKTWKNVDLSLIQADRQAFNIALDGIRADALQAGLNPVHLPEFHHRKIVQESPGGHRITSFVGTGTYIKQMSRPVRHVAYIGTRASARH
jgi:hypothetical protein